MAGTAASLFWIALCAVAAPVLAALVPRRLIPEVALLLGLGVLIGPGGLGLAAVGEGRDPHSRQRVFSGLQSTQIALYGATGLPIIVAVTAVAVKSEHMSRSNASLLVAGGAITVLLLPMTARCWSPNAESQPRTAALRRLVNVPMCWGSPDGTQTRATAERGVTGAGLFGY